MRDTVYACLYINYEYNMWGCRGMGGFFALYKAEINMLIPSVRKRAVLGTAKILLEDPSLKHYSVNKVILNIFCLNFSQAESSDFHYTHLVYSLFVCYNHRN